MTKTTQAESANTIFGPMPNKKNSTAASGSAKVGNGRDGGIWVMARVYIQSQAVT